MGPPRRLPPPRQFPTDRGDGFQRQVYNQPKTGREPEFDMRTRRNPELRQEVDRAIRPVRDRSHEPRAIEERPRITTNLSPELMQEFERLAKTEGKSKAELARKAIGALIEEDDATGRSGDVRVVVRNKTQLLLQTTALIHALEAAIAYDPKRHHNQPPPDLYSELELDATKNKNEIRELIEELKKLNAFIVASRKATAADNKSIIEVKKHLNTFLGKYAATTALGAGMLTIAVAATILQNLGVDLSTLAHVLPGHK